ncbi:MAG TPA: hypothetical protein IAA26_05200 [Candidatus Blautia faecipullorum]|nr:hypothetical protein [Candidatus Blautia faecipullorum]
MNYETLLAKADSHGLIVKEKYLLANDGRIKGNKIAIRKDIETQTEKSCVLAEELGHYYTSSGDILDQSRVSNQKQEFRARFYGYNLKIGLMGIVQAYQVGCRNLYEMAEYLEVTEDFLKEAIKCYRSKYGEYIKVDNYIIYFIPCLAVLNIIDD